MFHHYVRRVPTLLIRQAYECTTEDQRYVYCDVSFWNGNIKMGAGRRLKLISRNVLLVQRLSRLAANLKPHEADVIKQDFVTKTWARVFSNIAKATAGGDK